MICPNCNAEYREGFRECADCGVDLIDKLNTEIEKTEHRFNANGAIEILQALNFSEIAFIRSLLESENISHTFFGESAMSKTWGSSRARLMVEKTDADKAIELLKAAGIL